MYISRIYLKNIRCFDELELLLEKSGSSIQIIGDNGDGKSTILRSIAMGLCDQSSAAALFRELPGEYVRHGAEDEESFIELELDAGAGHKFTMRTDFVSLERFERVEQTITWSHGRRKKKVDPDDFHWDRIFVSGYGPGIRTYGINDFQHYLAVDAVYPLFRYDAMLQNPELIVRRLVDETRRRGRKLRTKERRAEVMLKTIRELLTSLLDLGSPRQVHFETFGIEIDGAHGKTGLASLGDGYRSTVTWTLDLVSWWMLYVGGAIESLKTESMRGIVLMDEIEQHLHPRWQRRILPDLRRLFPNIQFIVATHSPLVAGSCSDIAVHQVSDGQHTTHYPFGWSAEHIYEIMGLESSRSNEFRNEVLDRFDQLDRKRIDRSLTAAESREFESLKKRLKTLPSDDPSRLMIELNNLAKSLRTSGE